MNDFDRRRRMSLSIHHQKKPVQCLIVTISDTRTESTDKSGNLMIELLKQEGHTITSREIVPDDSKLIREKVIAGCENPDVDVILTNGGTGISFRDVTIETIDNILDKEIHGLDRKSVV